MIILRFATALLLLATFWSVSGFAESVAESGNDVRWDRRQVRVEISRSLLKGGTAIRPNSDVVGAVNRSFQAWSRVSGVEFEISWTDRQSLGGAGPQGDGINLITIAPVAENLIFLAGDDSPAKSRVLYGRRREISEADIVLNPIQQFSTDGAFGTFDLQSTLTHEIGHLLGLNHSPVISATMYELQARNGVFGLNAVSMRTLSEDDLCAVRSAYSPEGTHRITGKLTSNDGQPLAAATVWIEDALTGRVTAGRYTSKSGEFLIDGILPGEYTVFSQIDRDGMMGFEVLGTVSVTASREQRVNRRLLLRTSPTTMAAFGYNGQFANLPLSVSPGSELVLQGIVGWASEKSTVGAPSPYFVKRSGQVHVIGRESAIIEAGFVVDGRVGTGCYSLIFTGPNGSVASVGILDIAD